ncbi:MAG: prohibitin family protein [Patescibacteria group bacterium]
MSLRVVGKLTLLVLVLLCISFLTGCAKSVSSGHVGIKTNWGKVTGQAGEGLNWYFPIGNAIEVIDCRTQKAERSTSAASKDLQTVTTTIAVNYHIDRDKAKNLFSDVGYSKVTVSNGQESWKEYSYVTKIIDPRIDEILKSVTAKYTASQLITERQKVKQEVEVKLTRGLKDYDITVEPGGVSITDFDFSKPFNDSIEEKQVAEQTAQKALYELQQAEIQKKIDIMQAEGKARANQIQTQSLSKAVLEQKWIDKWDGHLPQAMGSNILSTLPGSPLSR